MVIRILIRYWYRTWTQKNTFIFYPLHEHEWDLYYLGEPSVLTPLEKSAPHQSTIDVTVRHNPSHRCKKRVDYIRMYTQ